jgi:hypothetical protein
VGLAQGKPNGKEMRKFEFERAGVLTRADAMSADASIAGIFLSVYQHSGDSEWRQALERDVEDSRPGRAHASLLYI